MWFRNVSQLLEYVNDGCISLILCSRDMFQCVEGLLHKPKYMKLSSRTVNSFRKVESEFPLQTGYT